MVQNFKHKKQSEEEIFPLRISNHLWLKLMSYNPRKKEINSFNIEFNDRNPEFKN
jgi:hypothetical protein